jgi:hypothetical protein
MKLVRIIAAIGLYLTRIISIGYVITALYVLCSVILKLPSFRVLENKRFAIDYPFTSKHFLLGSENTATYIFEMIAVIIFYGVFFWLLSNVFKTFRQQKLFTTQGVKHLKWFYAFNLFICPVLFTILSFYSMEDYPYVPMIIAHVILGIFAVFLAAIFEQGLKLQNDQDLYI